MDKACEYSDLIDLSLTELRDKWARHWGMKPHARIGRKMLEASLIYKMWEQAGVGLTLAQQRQLSHMVKAYKRNPNMFNDRIDGLKPGTRLVRDYNDKRYSVMVGDGYYIYKDTEYTSLSQIAFKITGTRWNGWKFFGLNKKGGKA